MLVYIDEIKSAKTVKEQNELKTKYGVNDAVNPLYQLNVDIIKYVVYTIFVTTVNFT